MKKTKKLQRIEKQLEFLGEMYENTIHEINKDFLSKLIIKKQNELLNYYGFKKMQ